MKKTNAMRLLDAALIPYEIITYDADDEEGTQSLYASAERAGIAAERIFKTLVLRGASGEYAVFCIPIIAELDLKKAASAAGEKKIDLIPLKDLFSVTGYIRGGCSPIGMKKKFFSYIDEIAGAYETVTVSAGIRGAVLCVQPLLLQEFLGANTGDFIL
jgi:Cys-tRNA(Pro)/Cys-tRNA(Cys) deacylase